MKRETPRRETLPNARTLTARYKRITCAHLPENIRLRQPYKQREVPQGRLIAVQQGRGFGSNIFKFTRKIAKTPAVRELGKMSLNELLNLYNTGTNKTKNKKC